MRIALIGASGQLGTDLHPQLSGEVIPVTHAEVEVSQPESIQAMLDRVRPDMVINTAAYNLVDKAETELEAAMSVNAWGPRNLALACAKRGLSLVHLSTDYVFGLETSVNTPLQETDLTGPQGVYAASKLMGEYFVRSLCPRHFVVRTCGLYGQSATKAKGNFVLTMLRLAKERPQLKVVSDQLCVPSYTHDVAEVIAALVKTDSYGLYHATNSGESSWFEVASETVRLAGLSTPILPITTQEFGAPAPRPAYSVLDCTKITGITGIQLRPWKQALAAYLHEIGAVPE